jgi:hypothetical protein
MLTVGSRVQVWNGNAKKTSGGLTKKDLFKKKGRIRSRKASKKAKKNNNLKKAGWTFKKGEFGAIKIEDKKKKSKKNTQKGGTYVDVLMRDNTFKQLKDILIRRHGKTLSEINDLLIEANPSVGGRRGRGRDRKRKLAIEIMRIEEESGGTI